MFREMGHHRETQRLGACLSLGAPDNGRDLLSWVTFVPVADLLRENWPLGACLYLRL